MNIVDLLKDDATERAEHIRHHEAWNQRLSSTIKAKISREWLWEKSQGFLRVPCTWWRDVFMVEKMPPKCDPRVELERHVVNAPNYAPTRSRPYLLYGKSGLKIHTRCTIRSRENSRYHGRAKLAGYCPCISYRPSHLFILLVAPPEPMLTIYV